VAASGRYQWRDGASAHGSAATPESSPPACATHPAAIHPPKNSTNVPEPRSFARNGTCTCAPAGTVSGSPPAGLRVDRCVTRTSTGSGPGFASSSVTSHPGPPPCGQNHAPDGAPTARAVSGAAGPAASTYEPAASTDASTEMAATSCPRVRVARCELIGRRASA
jgi:hypothetical protein